jgi:hypothetical protein
MNRALLLLVAACGDLGGLDVIPGASLGTGSVFVCQVAGADLEFCWRDNDAADLAGVVADACGAAMCGPSSRQSVCLYQCPPRSGCNALQSCFCSEHPRCAL